MLTSAVALGAAFVLITQNHLARLSDRQMPLGLQVTRLAETEITKALQSLQAVAAT